MLMMAFVTKKENKYHDCFYRTANQKETLAEDTGWLFKKISFIISTSINLSSK